MRKTKRQKLIDHFKGMVEMYEDLAGPKRHVVGNKSYYEGKANAYRDIVYELENTK
jgi:hypothetical protein